MREEAALAGVEPLEWLLLTSLPVRGRDQAKQVLDWYRLRWQVEDWHRVPKSGCKVELLRIRQDVRIERAATIKAVIGWRLTVMALLGNDTPELPPDTLFSDTELAVLMDVAADREWAPPDNLGRAMLATARLGGYLDRQHDAPLGTELLWRGYTRLANLAQA